MEDSTEADGFGDTTKSYQQPAYYKSPNSALSWDRSKTFLEQEQRALGQEQDLMGHEQGVKGQGHEIGVTI